MGQSILGRVERWHDYIGDGTYMVGKYGITFTDDLNDLIEVWSDEDGELELNNIYNANEGSVIQVEKLQIDNDNLSDDIYRVTIIVLTGNSQFDCYTPEISGVYYASDHCIFGSGNTKLY